MWVLSDPCECKLNSFWFFFLLFNLGDGFKLGLLSKRTVFKLNWLCFENQTLLSHLGFCMGSETWEQRGCSKFLQSFGFIWGRLLTESRERKGKPVMDRLGYFGVQFYEIEFLAKLWFLKDLVDSVTLVFQKKKMVPLCISWPLIGGVVKPWSCL